MNAPHKGYRQPLRVGARAAVPWPMFNVMHTINPTSSGVVLFAVLISSGD
jgi:hypothetical protein